ncbi:MAG: adenylyl-sulfate kinase [Phycisphaerae bacterium]|nr:adenylyl-sulfate kinase [Phycisphaerae bacterium]NUQ47435.1 adenylyl-sulfate kinase [Phycisphaerae bacterium]
MTQIKATNVVWHHGHVDRAQREEMLQQKGCTIWLTGLPSSGKSTLAFSLEHLLVERGHLAYVLDGDNIRHGLNKNLGFSAEDRAENIRRIGEVARLFADAGIITLTSFVSPYRADRDNVRKLHEESKLPFVEVFIDTPVDECEKRDPKGLYAKARAGQIKGFTGVDDPYEPPQKPELVVKTGGLTPQEATIQLLEYLVGKGLLPTL